MFVRLKPDISGAYLLDPKFKILNDGTTVRFSVLKNEPPGFAREAVVTQAYPPAANHEVVCEKLWPMIVNDFSKRKNVALLTYGQSGSGKSYTLDYLVPLLFEKLKPALQNAEQVAAEAAAEAQEVNNGVLSSDTMRRKGTRVDFDNQSQTMQEFGSPSFRKASSSPQKQLKKRFGASPTRFSGWGYSDNITLSPKVIVARGTANRFRVQSPRAPSQTFEASLVAPVVEAAPQEHKEEKPPSQSKPGLTMLRNNGRKGNQEVPVFGGAEWPSYCQMPSMPRMGHLIMCCTIEFWVKTADRSPCTLLSIVNTEGPAPMLSIELGKNISRDPEQTAILFYVCDKVHKEAVAKVNKDIFDDRWHHIQWEIQDLAQNRMLFFIDGQRVVNMTLGEQGNPSRFLEDWPHSFTVGATLNHAAEGSRQVMHDQFHGSVVDLRIYDKDHTMLCHWPFDEQDGVEIKNHGKLQLHGELINAMWQTVRMPETAMYFNGKDTYINVGCLADFGSKINNCALDLWFRTNNHSDRMALFHVTDSKKKHSCFGIELNANEEGEYCKGCTWFYIRDASGKSISATLTADLCNDAWHSISWKITSASTNQMTVMIDGARVDLDYAERSSPSHFEPWSQWVCLGAANRRGRSVANFFRGYIKEVKLWHSGHVLVASWELGEGIGAKVVMDSTGNGHNGICRFAGHWGAQWLSVDLPAALENRDDVIPDYDGTEERKFDNNRVRFCYLQLHSGPDSKGLYQERLWDTMHNRALDGLQPVVWKSRRACSEDFQPLAVIPDSSWVEVTSENLINQWEKVRQEAQNNKAKRGHHIISLALGDSFLTIFDLKGWDHSRQANFDRTLFQWTNLKTSFGGEEKAKLCIAKAHNNFDKCLIELGMSPQLYKRAISRHDTIPFHGSLLTQLLESSVCFGEEPAMMAVLVTASADPSSREAGAVIELLTRLRRRAELYAAIVVQKTIRAFRARKKCRILCELREKERARQRRAAELQRRFPDETKTKSDWVALVIAISRYDDERIGRLCHPSYGTDVLVTVLTALGYHVTHMHDDSADEALRPTRFNIMRQLDALNGLNAQILVYICGRGAQGIFYNGPTNQDFQREYAWYVRQQELAAARAEAERQRQEEEAARLQAEAEAEAKRLAEEAAAAAAAAEAEKKNRKGKVVEKKEEPPKKASPKKAKGKKVKVEEPTETVAAPSAQDETNAVKEEVDEPPPVFFGQPDSDPTVFILPSDAQLEFSQDQVITLDDVRERVLGSDAHLGVHAILCIDLAPPGDPYWWKPSPEKANGEKGLFLIEFSSRDSLHYYSNDRYHPIGSYYFTKGISGCAIPSRRGDVPEAENNRVTIDSFLRYLSFKLRTKVMSSIVIRTEEGSQEYVGELIPAKKVYRSKGDRKEMKRSSKRKRYMILLEFSCPPPPKYSVESCSELLLQVIVDNAGPGEKDNIQLCAFDVLPYACLYFRAPLVETRRVLQNRQWATDIATICSPVKVRWHFENADDSCFRVQVQCIDETVENSFLLRRVLAQNWESMRCVELPVDHLEFYCSIRVSCNPQQQSKLEKHYRLGDLHPDLVATYVQLYNEEHAKLMDEQDKRDAEARERQAAELDRQKRLAAEAEREREAQLERERQLQASIIERCNAMKRTKMLGSDDDINFIFQFPNNPVTTAAALDFCYDFIKAAPTNAVLLAEQGVVEYACKALVAHKQPEIVLPACGLIAEFSLVTAKVKVVDDIDDFRKGILKLGGVSPLADVLRSFMDEVPIAQVAIAAIAGMATTEARTILAQRGAVELILSALGAHANDPTILANSLWALDGLTQRSTPDQQQRCLELALNNLTMALDHPVALGRAYGLIARLAPVLEAAKKQCELLAFSAMEAMRKNKEPILLGNGMTLIAEVMNLKALVEKGLLGLVAMTLQSSDVAHGPRGALSCCSVLERLKGEPHLKMMRGDLETPLKGLKSIYGDGVTDKVKGALAIFGDG